MNKWIRFAIFAIPAVFILIIFLLISGRFKKPFVVKAPVTTTARENTAVSEPPAPLPPPLSEEQKQEFALNQLATQFTERFGSYSNQSPGTNLEELTPVMTARMQTWAAGVIARARAAAKSAYEGVTTRALGVTELTQDGTAKAAITVATRREEQKNGARNTYSQTLRLVAVKDGETWKIDEATWLPVR